jgi:hypothetical protein
MRQQIIHGGRANGEPQQCGPPRGGGGDHCREARGTCRTPTRCPGKTALGEALLIVMGARPDCPMIVPGRRTGERCLHNHPVAILNRCCGAQQSTSGANKEQEMEKYESRSYTSELRHAIDVNLSRKQMVAQRPGINPRRAGGCSCEKWAAPVSGMSREVLAGSSCTEARGGRCS